MGVNYIALFCCASAETFWTNPQYRVMVVDADEGDDDDTGTLIIALLQKERRLKRTEGAEYLTIGYAIYKVSWRHSQHGYTCLVSKVSASGS